MNSKTARPKMRLTRVIVNILSVFLIIVCVGPLLFVAWNSSKSAEEYWTSKFTPPNDIRYLAKNVEKLIDIGIIKQIRNTVIVTAIGILLSATFTSMAGFAFSKLDFPGRMVIFWSIVSLLAMPTQLLIVPLYVMFSRLNMINNPFTLAVIYATFGFSFGTFFMRSFYIGIPDEILDSARIDGAGMLLIYLKLMLPLGKPAIITLAVLNFFGFWNELFVSYIFNHTKESRLVTSGIAMLQAVARAGGGITDWTLIYTGILLSLIIPFMVYFIFQRRLSTGITMGAVKG